jgi:hypothetical protein
MFRTILQIKMLLRSRSHSLSGDSMSVNGSYWWRCTTKAPFLKQSPPALVLVFGGVRQGEILHPKRLDPVDRASGFQIQVSSRLPSVYCLPVCKDMSHRQPKRCIVALVHGKHPLGVVKTSALSGLVYHLAVTMPVYSVYTINGRRRGIGDPDLCHTPSPSPTKMRCYEKAQ